MAKFSDRQIALMMGSLNTGETNMVTRLICEASYRLVRAGGAGMTEEEDELLDELMTSEYRLRQAGRERRRKSSKRAAKSLRVAEGGSHNRGAAAAKVRCIR